MHLGAMRHPLRQLQQFCSLAAATTAATTAATLGQASERRIQGQEPTGSMAVWGGVGNAVLWHLLAPCLEHDENVLISERVRLYTLVFGVF